MTVLEFWGCALITFGPALIMFAKTVAHDPVKIILLISSSFFWLMSFFVVAILWAIIRTICDYLIIGALLAVLSQEVFRYLFHVATKKAQVYLAKVINSDGSGELNSSTRSSEIRFSDSKLSHFRDKASISYGKFEGKRKEFSLKDATC